MTDPIAVVAKIASTPDQAKLYVAMLQAEGIPAYVDGATLADEFAMSRAMLNLSSVRVMVPTASLAKAKEILEPAEIDLDELTRQALEAADDDEP